MNLTEDQIEQIKLNAIASYPEEAIWFITEKKGLYPVENVHPHPENNFSASSLDSFAAQKEGLLAVIHSHCDTPEVPSKLDMELHARLEVPCGILSTDGTTASNLLWMGGSNLPLIGRPFTHGIADCYSIVRDYFSQVQGVAIEDVPRDWQWWEDGEDYISELFESRGFKEISKSEAKEGDVCLIRVRGKVIHHCGVLVKNDLLLHHPGADHPIDRSKLSVEEPIYRYLPYVEKFVRYVK